MGDEFDDFVVEAEEGNENEHNRHVDEESENAASDKFEEFGEEVGVFNFENEAAVSEVGKEDGDDPGNDVGDLELINIFGVEDGIGKGVIGAEADEGGEDANDEVADDFGVFGVFGFEEMAKFGEGHLRTFWVRLVSRVM